MPRKGPAPKHPVIIDPVYGSPIVTALVNKVLMGGKRSLAQRIVYDALSVVGERTGSSPVEELENAIKQLTPVLEVRSRRVGGATYQVPVEVPARRARTLAVRWLVEFARARGEKSMAERLANEHGARILMVDKRGHVGGNAYDEKDEAGILIHRYGPHIFHTNSDEVFAYLSRFTAWRPYEHRVRAVVRDKV